MHCLKCKSENMQISFQSIADPAKDKFGCLNCGHIQFRYTGTKYETEKEKEKRNANRK